MNPVTTSGSKKKPNKNRRSDTLFSCFLPTLHWTLTHGRAETLLIPSRKVFTDPSCCYPPELPPSMHGEKKKKSKPARAVPSTLASSTRMISLSRMAGEVWRTLYTVLSRVVQASLWNTIITLVVGRGGQRLKVCSIHLWQHGEGAQRCDCPLQFLS